MDIQFIKTAFDVMTPVLESSMILAAEYTKGCGRSTVTARDMNYAMKYAARNLVGKQIGTLFPELYNSESDSEDDESVEEVDEDDEPFTRYQGDIQLLNDINQAVDTWTEWEPVGLAEILLRDSINGKYNELGQ